MVRLIALRILLSRGGDGIIRANSNTAAGAPVRANVAIGPVPGNEKDSYDRLSNSQKLRKHTKITVALGLVRSGPRGPGDFARANASSARLYACGH